MPRLTSARTEPPRPTLERSSACPPGPPVDDPVNSQVVPAPRGHTPSVLRTPLEPRRLRSDTGGTQAGPLLKSGCLQDSLTAARQLHPSPVRARPQPNFASCLLRKAIGSTGVGSTSFRSPR